MGRRRGQVRSRLSGLCLLVVFTFLLICISQRHHTSASATTRPSNTRPNTLPMGVAASPRLVFSVSLSLRFAGPGCVSPWAVCHVSMLCSVCGCACMFRERGVCLFPVWVMTNKAACGVLWWLEALSPGSIPSSGRPGPGRGIELASGGT